jgi:hypothetical protein
MNIRSTIGIKIASPIAMPLMKGSMRDGNSLAAAVANELKFAALFTAICSLTSEIK